MWVLFSRWKCIFGQASYMNVSFCPSNGNNDFSGGEQFHSLQTSSNSRLVTDGNMHLGHDMCCVLRSLRNERHFFINQLIFGFGYTVARYALGVFTQIFY
ncbi:hypothetical protein K7X08_005585 [Anisodus acutangulus]|uniref:Uncharacterized protein n=1 Tax=Anisodus acutangulus TaxID=402998 RepID=A0A9Q1R6H7_9SOLA|nr:hypothetical protein K7X08_005585 [Anisodus acutangulus]